ncbi:Nn.00g055870.m01.CDS01 [Neocucurbitaria sp. VM-36]
MDPLSLTASILAITTTCLKSAHLLDSLREKYKHAQMTITALCAEATVISASLSQIQSLILGNSGAIITQLRPRSEVLATFDSALTGCAVVLAVLDDEIAALISEGQDGEMSWTQKAKIIWKDGVMKDLLLQLRGQSAAIGLLIQALQVESISGIKELLQQNSLLLDHVMRQTQSLRDTHPKVKAPRSVFDTHLEEIGSVIGTEHTGLSDSTFLFDDVIVDSKVYRRVLAQARSKVSLTPEKEESDHPPGITETPNSQAVVTDHYGHNLRLFVSNLSANKAFQTLRETTQKNPEFMDDELSAIKQWFYVLSPAERKTALYSLAEMSLKMDCSEVEESGVPSDVVVGSFPQNKRYGWI